MRVVVNDYEFPNLEPEKKALKDVPGLELIDVQCKTPEDVLKATEYADGILNQWCYLHEGVIKNMKNCKVIATYGIGTDKIDVDTCSKRGIYVCNIPDYNKHEVADHTLTLLLVLSRQVLQLDRLIRQGKYGFYYLDNKLYRSEGQTLGVVGFGKIPCKVAYKCQMAMDMKILCYDPYVTAEQAAEAGATKVELPELMAKSDFVSIHVPLTEQTKYMIDEKMLALMKPTAYLINCGRGAVVKESALYEVLKSKKIAGAAIDVFEKEPIATDDPLLTLDNVIVTPHSAWHTQESMYDMQWGAAHQVALVLEGKDPTHAVNFDAVKNANRK